MEVTWQSEALRLLDKRDRYTRNAIVEEFTRDPEKDAVTFDPEQAGFVTSVSDGRFSVIWTRMQVPDQIMAVVRAVVPLAALPKSTDQPDELKNYIQRAVDAESNGTIVV
jgi:hypothetical protein